MAALVNGNSDSRALYRQTSQSQSVNGSYPPGYLSRFPVVLAFGVVEALTSGLRYLQQQLPSLPRLGIRARAVRADM